MLYTVPEGERKLVTSHGSFDYFADQYGFDVVGVIIPGGSTTAEPSSEELADLVHVIEEEEVGAIFGETIEPTDLAETISAEVGSDVVVVELYTGSLGEPGSDAGTYIWMLKTNAGLIADALG